MHTMPWYEEWFDRDEYELVYPHRDEVEAAQVIDLVERVARPEPSARVLDVGCGRGRHARVLARRGYRVTGIDLSERALDEARQRADEEGLAIDFRQGDMREALCTACFDGMVNLFTAFGYFDDEADHLRALQAMATALRPGGWLVQDFLNAPHVRATLVEADRRVEDGVVITQQRWIESGRINKKITLRRNGDQRSFHESVRLLTLADFERLYAAAGLEVLDVLGDYDGRSYAADAPRLILHARRTEDAAA